MRRRGVTSWRSVLIIPIALVFVVVCSRDLVVGKNGTWTPKAPMLTPRHSHAVGVVNGILYAVGGATLTGSDYLNTVEAYDPARNIWTVKAPMPTPREGHAVGVVNGILYAVGGTSRPVGGRVLSTVEAYDPSTNTWSVKAPMLTPRSSHAVGVVNGILYAVGGMGGPGGEYLLPLNTVEAYDPTKNMWTARTPMTPHKSPAGSLSGWEKGRSSLAVGVVNGILYAVGGVCCYPGENAGILSTVEAYNPITNTWTAKAPLPTPRYGHAVGVANGILYAVGGVSKVRGIVSTVEAYDPNKNAWTARPPMPTGRNYLALGVVKASLYAVGGLGTFGSGSALKVVLDGSNYALKVAP